MKRKAAKAYHRFRGSRVTRAQLSTLVESWLE
jgi:hypothetical protein